MSFQVAQKLARNGFALLSGLAVGSAANMGLIMLNTVFFPLPPGVTLEDKEGFAAYIQDLPMTAYVLVFAAHYAQAVVGGYVAARLACCTTAARLVCFGVTALTAIGAVMNLQTLPVPAWAWLELVAYPALAYYTAKAAITAMDKNKNV